MIKLTTQQRTYITQAEQFYRDFHLPPSAGKVLGYLLICEPAQQSEEMIQQVLGLSIGSANNAVRTLTKAGLITCTRQPDQRRLYYEIKPGIWRELFMQRLQMGERAFLLAKEGLKLGPDNARLKAMHAFYKALDERMQQFLDEEYEGL